MRPFTGLNYLKVSLLSEEDQKSNGTNPRIQLMFVKKHTTQQISTGRGGERLEREKSCIFTSFYLRATVTHLTSLHPRPPPVCPWPWKTWGQGMDTAFSTTELLQPYQWSHFMFFFTWTAVVMDAYSLFLPHTLLLSSEKTSPFCIGEWFFPHSSLKKTSFSHMSLLLWLVHGWSLNISWAKVLPQDF